MSLPAPKLDDRTFADLKDEALRKIPERCPEWTDFNPSDPGVTLVELMAWMTETVLYRLNRVPEKNYIRFLELIGTRLRPAQPARAWVSFSVSAKDESSAGTVPAGTRLSTSGQDEPVPFATCEELNLTTRKIIEVRSRFGETSREIHLPADPPGDLFTGGTNVAHLLYLGDNAFSELDEDTVLILSADISAPAAGSLFLEWEYWNPQDNTWEIVIPRRDSTLGFRKSGQIEFERLPKIEPCVVNEQEANWLRARLVSAEAVSLPKLTSLQRSIRLSEDRIVPEGGLLHGPIEMTVKVGSKPRDMTTDQAIYQPIDFARAFYPFGKRPTLDNAMYLRSPIFSKQPGTIRLYFSVAGSPAAQPSTDLEIAWVYYDRNGVRKTIGTTGPQGTAESFLGLNDDTRALTQNGAISFMCPPDIAAHSLGDREAGWYIGAELIRGGYEDGRAPRITSVFVSFEGLPQHLDHYVSENYSAFAKWDPGSEEGEFQPFMIRASEDPALYLGFDGLLSDDLHCLHFDLDTLPDPDCDARVLWEYSSDQGWAALSVLDDGTHSLSKTGTVRFHTPSDWAARAEFERSALWLRLRWPFGYCDCPAIKSIRLNTVEVTQETRVEDQRLGASDGTAGQEFVLGAAPILPDPVIFIEEPEGPAREQEDRLAKEGQTGWSRWEEVHNLYQSKPGDCHFVADLQNGLIRLGDGTRGRVPPIGAQIRATYRLSMGRRGNVGSHTITVIEDRVQGVDSVTNSTPAESGEDPETIDEARIRGPWVLKHRHRAVTREDFEHLARQSSLGVAKAQCFEQDGVVYVVVLPEDKNSPRPRPSGRLVELVRRYLDERRMINTRLRVIGPEYVPIEIEVEVEVARSHQARFQEVKHHIIVNLAEFFHPLCGGPEGRGWPMGRSVHISELYYRLEQVEGVDHIDRVRMRQHDTRSGLWTSRIPLYPTAFPCLLGAPRIQRVGG